MSACASMPLQVNGNDLPARRQRGHQRPHHPGRHEGAMEHYQRHAAISVALVVHLEAVDRSVPTMHSRLRYLSCCGRGRRPAVLLSEAESDAGNEGACDQGAGHERASSHLTPLVPPTQSLHQACQQLGQAIPGLGHAAFRPGYEQSVTVLRDWKSHRALSIVLPLLSLKRSVSSTSCSGLPGKCELENEGVNQPLRRR